MHFVDAGEQCRGRYVLHDRIGKAPGQRVGNSPLAMPGDDIGMRLVEDEGVGIGGPDLFKQGEVAANLAAAEQHREIVLDLAGHRIRRTPAGMSRIGTWPARLYLVTPRATSCAISRSARSISAGANSAPASRLSRSLRERGS